MRVIGSVLHGAYGDYYEQALCLKHFKATHPEVRLRLFAASGSRLRELSVLDFSFAESFTLWNTLTDYSIDEFLQFQCDDPELRAEVLEHLPPHVQSAIRRGGSRLPWTVLRSILPLPDSAQLCLTAAGRSRLVEVMRENGVTDSTFDQPTVGFLWRYRSRGSAIRPWRQPSAESLVRKYSRVFGSAIEAFDCNVMVCGMKVEAATENRERVDAKYPRFGLDLPPDRTIHMKGLSWPLELEILTRCSVCLVNPSGFSEALYIRRAAGVIVTDPPLHYRLKLLKHRMPLFGNNSRAGFFHIWRSPHSENQLFGLLGRALKSTTLYSAPSMGGIHNRPAERLDRRLVDKE